ncbi:MAG: response regulator [Ignavibacteriales bacterium]|nr:response regulator [Ignavibacteriales bacterium]
MEDIRTASLDANQKSQIEEWLREADKNIRTGRYLAADELLQKVFAIHPQNTTARAFQDRIQFLVKQLSQRVGLEDDMYKEIKKYRDLITKRGTIQLNNLLSSAQNFLKEGNIRKANEQISKALSLDSQNSFAKALQQQLIDLQNRPGVSAADVGKELKFCAILKESWKDGIPNDAQEALIAKMQQEFSVTPGKRLQFERETKNLLYKESLESIWATGGLSAFTTEAVDALRKKYEVSRVDHAVIESNLLKEFRKNRIRGTILVVDEDDQTLLNITSALRTNHFAVIGANNIGEALSCLKIATPNVIISESHFQSGEAGFELYNFIRGNSFLKGIPFIFITGSLDRTTLLIGKRLGVDEFVPKPIDYELLVAIITGKIHRRTN